MCDLAWHLNKSQNAYEAVDYVRPGGQIRAILPSINNKEANLIKDDAIVILCGNNDMARDEGDEVINGTATVVKK